MLFNSINFAIFFPLVFFVYWLILKKDLKKQNIFLLLVSYFFYACWDWRFMFLLAISTILCYYGGLKVSSSTTYKSRKAWMLVSVIVNIGFLGFFKYFNFFIESFQEFLLLFGLNPHIHTLQIILPVGISFYTFHGLSYVLDIYNEKIKPTKSWIDYSLFVSFFPLLVAGPIERATHLLPQITEKRTFNYRKMVDGLKQILWGLFKKIVIADGCAEYVNPIFDNPADQSGSTLVLAAIFFAFQIYGDFSGYTDIALGTARMLGFELLQNFKFPYFSRNINEFWSRWHISLTSWFRDYLYIPLGGSKGGKLKTLINTYIIFIVSGLWHGANWTFIIWGALHAVFVTPSIIFNTKKKYKEIVAFDRNLPTPLEFGNIVITFLLVALALIFFRSDSIQDAFVYFTHIPNDFFVSPYLSTKAKISSVLLIFMLVVEWNGRRGKYALEHFGEKRSTFFRWGFYYLVALLLVLFAGGQQAFIYFQF